MCGCSTKTIPADRAAEHEAHAITVRVVDMTCGHCAGTIKKAVETGLPGIQVHADSTSMLVRDEGSADLIAIKALISEAGYTLAA